LKLCIPFNSVGKEVIWLTATCFTSRRCILVGTKLSVVHFLHLLFFFLLT
jgi:hypothetical protein